MKPAFLPHRALVLSCLLAVALGNPPAEAAPLLLSGQALDFEKEPVAGARVFLFPFLNRYQRGILELSGRLQSEPVATATSDEGGWFEIEAPEIGFWRLRVEAEGLLPMETMMGPLLQSRTLAAVSLPASELLEIQIVDERGRGVAGAEVGLRHLDRPFIVSSLLPRIAPWASAFDVGSTDGQGQVNLRGQWGGHSQLRAVKPGSAAAIPVTPTPDQGLSLELPSAPRLPPANSVARSSIPVLDGQGRPMADVVLWAGNIPMRIAGSKGQAPDGQVPDGLPWPKGHLQVVSADGLSRPAELTAEGVVVPGPSIPFSIEVVDQHGRAISDALIWGWNSRPFAYTGPDGAFRGFHGDAYPPALLVAKQGFVTEATSWRAAGDGAEAHARVSLRPAGAIHGRVVDDRGGAVAGLEVGIEAHRSNRDARGLRLEPVFTGRDGRFRFDSLQPGKAFVLEIKPPGLPPTRLTAKTGDEVELVSSVGATVAGRLVDEHGGGIAGSVQLFHDPDHNEPPIRATADGHSVEPAAADEQGRFSIARVPRGLHGALITAPRHAPRVLMDLDLGNGESRELGELTLRRSTPLRLRLVDSEGRPVPGVEIRLNQGSLPPFRNRSGRALTSLLSRQLPSQLETDGQGRATVDGFIAGERLRLRFSHPGFLVTSQDFAVAEGEVEYELDAGQRIAGQVVDSSGLGLEGVRLTAEVKSPGPRSTGSYFVHTTSEADGNFTLTAVPSGRTLLTTRAEGFAPRQEVLHRADEATGLELVLERGLTLEGLVTGVRSEDLRLTSVRLVYEPKPGWRYEQSTVTEGDGSFEITGLLPGRGQLTTRHASYGRVEKEVVIEAGMAPVMLDLSRGLTVSGRVVDFQGLPLEQADLTLEAAGEKQSTSSRRDGSFSFVVDHPGDYVLVARKEICASRGVVSSSWSR